LSTVFDARKRAQQSLEARPTSGENQRETQSKDRAPRGLVYALLHTTRSDAPSAVLSSQRNETAGAFEPAALLMRSDPVYPNSAKDRRVTGKVELHFRVSAEGRTYDVKPVNGPAALAQAAVEAVKSWRFWPARLYGAPVDSSVTAEIDFVLP
jgi:TonB family protein